MGGRKKGKGEVKGWTKCNKGGARCSSRHWSDSAGKQSWRYADYAHGQRYHHLNSREKGNTRIKNGWADNISKQDGDAGCYGRGKGEPNHQTRKMTDASCGGYILVGFLERTNAQTARPVTVA